MSHVRSHVRSAPNYDSSEKSTTYKTSSKDYEQPVAEKGYDYGLEWCRKEDSNPYDGVKSTESKASKYCIDEMLSSTPERKHPLAATYSYKTVTKMVYENEREGHSCEYQKPAEIGVKGYSHEEPVASQVPSCKYRGPEVSSYSHGEQAKVKGLSHDNSITRQASSYSKKRGEETSYSHKIPATNQGSKYDYGQTVFSSQKMAHTPLGWQIPGSPKTTNSHSIETKAKSTHGITKGNKNSSHY